MNCCCITCILLLSLSIDLRNMVGVQNVHSGQSFATASPTSRYRQHGSSPKPDYSNHAPSSPHIPPELPLETPRCCPMPSTTHQSWYSLEKRDNPHDTGVIPEDEIARLHQLDRAHVFRLTAVVEHALDLGLT